MNKAPVLVAWMFCCGLVVGGGALACDEDERSATVVGLLVDARAYEHSEEDFSPEDDERLHQIAASGPLLAFLEEGTNQVRPFYGFPSDEPVGRIPEQHAPYIGRRLSVTGCVSDSRWPAVTDVTQIEILD